MEMKTSDQTALDQDELAKLAYSLWHKRGCPAGSPEQDWAEAEQVLKNGDLGTTAIRAVEDKGGSVQS